MDSVDCCWNCTGFDYEPYCFVINCRCKNPRSKYYNKKIEPDNICDEHGIGV